MELSLKSIGSARVVLIAGPTASGKSAAALQLAEEAGRGGRPTRIINADAMQVYAGLRVLTSRPTIGDEARSPHRLYGHVSPSVRYSVGAWLDDVVPALAEARAADALAIVVGGTGLYFKALTEGLAAVPDIPPEIRALWFERMQGEGVAALHALLAERDPASGALVRPTDPQRVLRALEVFEVTGLTLEQRQAEPPAPPLVPLERSAAFVFVAERSKLHGRVDERFDRMVAEGAMEEVRALLALRLDPNLPAMKAIGVREFAAVLGAETRLDAAISKAKTETRRYAKRQDTWFRNQMPGWQRVPA
jgi:tRNA dimethylallyltransferase